MVCYINCSPEMLTLLNDLVSLLGLLHGEMYNEKDRPHWEEGTNTCVLAMV